MATTAPMPATRAKLSGACLIPTSELIFNAKLTSSGAMNSRLVLMKAKAYSAMKPQPTRVIEGESSTNAAPAAGGSSDSSSPAASADAGMAPSTGRATSGTRTVLDPR